MSRVVGLDPNSLSSGKRTWETCATPQFSLRPGRDHQVSCFAPILFPPAKVLGSVALPTSSLSSWEGILQVLATHQLSFQLEKDFQGLPYPPVLSPAGKTSSRVSLSPNSCFRLVTYCGVLRYPPVLSPAGQGYCRFWLLTNCISGWKKTLEGCATQQLSLRLGRDRRVCC